VRVDRRGALCDRAAERGRVVVEDSFGGLALPAGDGMTVDRYPLMIRPPAVEPLPGPDPGGCGGGRRNHEPCADLVSDGRAIIGTC
jgi:hypothetical protein